MTHRSKSASSGQEEPEWFNLWAPKQIANTKFGVTNFNIHKIFTSGPTINLSFVGRPDDPEILNNHYQIQSREFWEKIKMTSCLLYTSPSPRDKRQSRMPSSA